MEERRLFLALALGLVPLCLSAPSTVHAASLFEGSVIGAYSNTSFSDPYFSYLSNNDAGRRHKLDPVARFAWGIGLNYETGKRVSSSFSFDGVGSDKQSAPMFSAGLGEAFVLGAFTYENMETVRSGGKVHVDFGMNVRVNGQAISPLTYRIMIDNTPNAGADPRDYVALVSSPVPHQFTLGGVSYWLEVLGFSRDGGASFEVDTYLAEKSATRAMIYGRISAVPIPATLPLLLAGLLVLGSLRRRGVIGR